MTRPPRPAGSHSAWGGSTAGRLQVTGLALQVVALAALPLSLLLSWMVIGLTLLTALKLRESRSLQERRLVGLLQLVAAGLLTALLPDLAPSLLQALLTLLALAGLLALEVGEGPGWRALLRRSFQVALAALPVALVLFVLLPRLAPFGALGGPGGAGARTGLSDTLEPGSIAALARDSAPAARVAFPGGTPPPPGQRYWRVLVHDRFDGVGWSGGAPPLPPDRGTPEAAGASGGASQLWFEEPSGLQAVPWDGRARALGSDLRVDPTGELRHRGSSASRRIYALAPAPAPPVWQRTPPTPMDLGLPVGHNPRLEALAADWSRLGAAPLRVAAARSWFRRQPFRYSLTPGTLPEGAPLDAFLFERREGFCGHYASAFSALMRAAGVPARVVSGYRGGVWVVPLGGTGYLDLRRSDAHAWSEVWLERTGWVAVDPTAWVSGGGGQAATEGRRGGPLQWLVRQWWGLDLAWSRWWLGFDRRSQEALLRQLFGAHLENLGLVVLGATALGLAGGLALHGHLQQGRSGPDALRRELERCLETFRRRGTPPRPGESLLRYAGRLEGRWPEVGRDLRELVALYQGYRFAPGAPRSPRAVLAHLRRSRRRLEGTLRRCGR